jgi:plastocyanin
MKAVLGIVVAVIILVGVGYAVMNHSSKSNNQTGSNNQSSGSSSGGSGVAATITYGDNGFSPSSTSIKSGQKVTFKNNASDNVQVDSNPHPVHTDDTDLNVGTISPGQSKTVTLTKTGSFGFHNHLNPAEQSQITIQ